MDLWCLNSSIQLSTWLKIASWIHQRAATELTTRWCGHSKRYDLTHLDIMRRGTDSYPQGRENWGRSHSWSKNIPKRSSRILRFWRANLCYVTVLLWWWDRSFAENEQYVLLVHSKVTFDWDSFPGVHEMCQVRYSISCTKLWMEDSYSNPLTKEKWRNCYFDLLIHLGKASLDFVVMYKGEILAAVEAEYKEDF